MINQSCLDCDHFRDDCVGKPGECVRHTRIDFSRGPKTTAIILPTIPPTIISGGDSRPIPISETRQQKFARIGKKRQEQALEAIRKLEHLTSRYRRQRTGVTTYTYAWTAEQALDLVKPIEEALEQLKSELICPDRPNEHGLIEEMK